MNQVMQNIVKMFRPSKYFNRIALYMSNSKRDLYNSVKWQNEHLENEIAKTRDQYSTDEQRIKYIHSDISGWLAVNYILWFIYYLVFVIVSYLLYENEKYGYTNKRKWFYWTLFLVFPFLITTVELFLYNFFSFIWSLVIARPYPKDRNTTPSLSIMDALPPVYY